MLTCSMLSRPGNGQKSPSAQQCNQGRCMYHIGNQSLSALQLSQSSLQASANELTWIEVHAERVHVKSSVERLQMFQ